MRYCTEIEFKNSSYGKRIIAQIKKNYSTPDRPIVNNYFTTGFLKAYAEQYRKSLTCYQDLLEFWANDRGISIESEAQMAQGNVAYEKWVAENKSPFDVLGDLFKNIPLLITAVVVIAAINLVKK